MEPTPHIWRNGPYRRREARLAGELVSRLADSADEDENESLID